jgi:hypothetical protein
MKEIGNRFTDIILPLFDYFNIDISYFDKKVSYNLSNDFITNLTDELISIHIFYINIMSK